MRCSVINCPSLTCAKPQNGPGQCCPKCPGMHLLCLTGLGAQTLLSHSPVGPTDIFQSNGFCKCFWSHTNKTLSGTHKDMGGGK